MKKALSNILTSITVFFVLFFFSNVPYALADSVAFDAITTGNNNNANDTLSYSHTASGTNRIVFVWVWMNNNNDRLTSITYGGSAMTLVDKLVNSDNNNYAYLYYMVAPTTGAQNVVITSNTNPTNIRSEAVSYTGAKQSGQPDAHGTISSSKGAGATQTITLTTVASNAWMVSTCNGAGDLPNASTGFTSRGTNGSERVGDSNGGLAPGSNSMSCTNSGASSESLTMLAASIAPAVSAATFNFWQFFTF